MPVRKERFHHTGQSNRAKDAVQCVTAHSVSAGDGPIDFDNTVRSVMARKMQHHPDLFVPVGVSTGEGNREFKPRLPGHDFRQPKSDLRETRRIRLEQERQLAETAAMEAEKPPKEIAALDRTGHRVNENPEKLRPPRQKGSKVAPRWNPARWYGAPTEEQAPLQKEEGETWNSLESQKIQGAIKGQDRLMRSVRRPEDVATPQSEAGFRHPLSSDTEEYYPGRSLVDADNEDPGNDYQVRPIPLPDFGNPPPGEDQMVARMRRMRTVIRQRYAGRPRLIGVFRNCSLTKPGFMFPRDMQQIFDQMGVNVTEDECALLIKAVDKDQKGAVTFEEFSDLIYGSAVNVGGPTYEPQERHVRHVTKTLVDGLVANGNVLGRAFCELDPERRYLITKAQFANALSTACNHISRQAVDFLWASQFPTDAGATDNPSDLESRCVDWRVFMSELAHFAHSNRPATPCYLQGRKRQYDLLQRSAAVTGGFLSDLDLNRPDQNPDDEVYLVADKLVYRQSELPHLPRDAALLTVPYVEDIQGKAFRVERTLWRRVPKARMRELLKNREMVHQDELVDLLCKELEVPMGPDPLPPQEPLYAAAMPGRLGPAEVMTLDLRAGSAEESKEQPVIPAPPPFSMSASSIAADDGPRVVGPTGGPGRLMYAPPAVLKLTPADIQAYVATQRTNRENEVQVESFMANVYKPEDERKVIDYVNDGLARHIRGHRPPRERPPNSEVQRHENYWQARYMMELLADSIAAMENSNGGKLKPSKVFKRLDMDNDGYISLSDLRSACEKYKVPNSSADLHALFSQLDKEDHGSIHIGEFTRHFEVHQGSILDAMARPIKAVLPDGGVQYCGPGQEKQDARERELAATHSAVMAAHQAGTARASSAPAGAGHRVHSADTEGRPRSEAGSASNATTLPIITETGPGRISDIMRARYSQWKPTKAELYTAPARTRFGMTVYSDTRHVTEPSVPLCAAYMAEGERFKTMNNTHSIFAVPDHKHPQAEDALQKHSKQEYRVERIRQRQREFTERCWAANEAAWEFDEKKIARKAMNQLNYERKVKMACA